MNTRHARTMLLLLSISLVSCGGIDKKLTKYDLPPAPVRGTTSEIAVLGIHDHVDVYSTVLTYFLPSGKDVRWVNTRMLGNSRDDGLVSYPSPGIVNDIVAAAGRPDICSLAKGNSCEGLDGGIITFSQVYKTKKETVRIYTQYETVSEYTSKQVSEEIFVMKREKEGWKLMGRSPFE